MPLCPQEKRCQRGTRISVSSWASVDEDACAGTETAGKYLWNNSSSKFNITEWNKSMPIQL